VFWLLWLLSLVRGLCLDGVGDSMEEPASDEVTVPVGRIASCFSVAIIAMLDY
jgi:hypothetical protein